jgi:hypothetical protein
MSKRKIKVTRNEEQESQLNIIIENCTAIFDDEENHLVVNVSFVAIQPIERFELKLVVYDDDGDIIYNDWTPIRDAKGEDSCSFEADELASPPSKIKVFPKI